MFSPDLGPIRLYYMASFRPIMAEGLTFDQTFELRQETNLICSNRT